MLTSVLLSNVLRAVEQGDLPHFFAHQDDRVASDLADVPMRDRASFNTRWFHILRNAEVTIRTIVADDGEVAGYVFVFPFDGELRLGYWLGRDFWGRGIGSRAVAEFLEVETRRPLYATVHRDNAASMRILERNGFEMTKAGTEAGPRYVLR
jgi:RimJ/RimL family protein N-acetyltransferase